MRMTCRQEDVRLMIKVRFLNEYVMIMVQVGVDRHGRGYGDYYCEHDSTIRYGAL